MNLNKKLINNTINEYIELIKLGINLEISDMENLKELINREENKNE